MTDITIRPATTADSPAIAGLVTQLGYPSTEAEIASRLAPILARPDYALWVAEASGSVVGLTGVFVHLAVEYDGLYGRLLGLVVDEPFRGQGIGKKLLDQTERWLRERGVSKLTLTSGKQRAEAHRFYRRLGYAESGFRFGKNL
ncbi:MAG: GNAT family N-acetyltransferase [Anaerolineales bacterium]|nr:GNAT family N-acetyltransferase [Anaerolineales bacterium]